jgi:hypothetical protein
MRYDPTQHDGLLNDGEHDIIVENAAVLHDLPIDAGASLRATTALAEALSHLRDVSEEERAILLAGYGRGITLLR